MTAVASSTLALQARPADRAAARAEAYAELQEMSKAMVEQKGLLNFAQAGLLLDVSTKRISELVRLRKLRRFDFLGRTYVSMREVGEDRWSTGKARRLRWPICESTTWRCEEQESRRFKEGVADNHWGCHEMIASATKNDGDVLISLERAGEMLGGISKKSVCRRIAGGVLPPPVKEGKFSRLFRSDVIRVIQEMKEERDKKYGVRNSG